MYTEPILQPCGLSQSTHCDFTPAGSALIAHSVLSVSEGVALLLVEEKGGLETGTVKCQIY
jgi:hypothetical protein